MQLQGQELLQGWLGGTSDRAKTTGLYETTGYRPSGATGVAQGLYATQGPFGGYSMKMPSPSPKTYTPGNRKDSRDLLISTVVRPTSERQPPVYWDQYPPNDPHWATGPYVKRAALPKRAYLAPAVSPWQVVNITPAVQDDYELRIRIQELEARLASMATQNVVVHQAAAPVKAVQPKVVVQQKVQQKVQQAPATQIFGGWSEAKTTKPAGARVIDEQMYDVSTSIQLETAYSCPAHLPHTRGERLAQSSVISCPTTTTYTQPTTQYAEPTTQHEYEDTTQYEYEDAPMAYEEC